MRLDHNRNERRPRRARDGWMALVAALALIGAGLATWVTVGTGHAVPRSRDVHPASPAQALSNRVGTPTTTGALEAVCGNGSLLTGPATPPAGAVPLPAGTNVASQLAPHTTYWLAPGVHTLGQSQYGQFQPAPGDTFIGAPGAILTGRGRNQYAFVGTATGVTIEYLTIEHFVGASGTRIVNASDGSTWTIAHDTVETNGGMGVGLGSHGVVEYDCLTRNQVGGFGGFGTSRTVVLDHNEISDNNPGWKYTSPTTGSGAGISGGGKFWGTTNATVLYNYVHTNNGVGIWVDTDNAGFDISHNYISGNTGEGIMYEISYNALISDNTLIGNARSGYTNTGFPVPAIYISESGGDARVASRYSGELRVTGNLFTNNWSGVVLWESPDRYCGDTTDGACTRITPTTFTIASCRAHKAGASPTQVPDYYDACRWRTRTVTVSHNSFNLTRRAVPHCSPATFCGVNGLFSSYGRVTPWKGWTVPLHVSDDQNNRFSSNSYHGPWRFDGFAQGEKVSWSTWTSGFTDRFGSGDRFHGQDAGSTYTPSGSLPPTSLPSPPAVPG